MSTHRPSPANAITRTVLALLGLGMLAGCTSGGSGGASPTASATRSTAAPASAPPASAPPASAPPAGLSAAGLLSAALAAVRAGGSVHVDVTSGAPDDSVTFSDDATGKGGRQVITFDGTGHATILLIDGVGYVQANADALQGLFQVPLQQAMQDAGKWISLRPGQRLGTSTYDDVTAGITLSSVAQELQFSGHLTKTSPATVAGQPVIGVQAPLPASDDLPAGAKLVLYVTDNAALRPVRYQLIGGGSTTNEFSFSSWGEKLTLTAPANAIPASSTGSGTTIV
jgi:hypothetical protein